MNRQYVADSISFWQFQPSSTIEQITQRTDLSDAGKFAFYSAQPKIETGDTFNTVCAKHEEHAAILGCYTANRIYVYDVTDPRLDGIKEVTAAHEMLHAVYQRLSRAEKATIDALLEAEYEKLKTVPAYAERMAYYARTEPGQRDNELHSIIGTEIASIDPALEAHYKKYFNDRSKILSLHKSYKTAFTELENQQKQLSAQLDVLSADIEQSSISYDTDAKILSSDISSFNRRSLSGEFDSRSQFDRERQQLVNRADALSAQRDSINEKVVNFNKLKDEYNEAVTQSNDLYKSMDSSLTPAPKV